jgi:hypothetical protein
LSACSRGSWCTRRHEKPVPRHGSYLEKNWGDVHHRLCTYSCDQIQEQLSDDLAARLGERLVAESLFDR